MSAQTAVQSIRTSTKEFNPLWDTLQRLTPEEAYKFIKYCTLEDFTEDQWLDVCNRLQVSLSFSTSSSTCHYNLARYFSSQVAFEKLQKMVDARQCRLGYGPAAVNEHRRIKMKLLGEFGVKMTEEQQTAFNNLTTIRSIDTYFRQLVAAKLDRVSG